MKSFRKLVILGITVTLIMTGITFAQGTSETFTITGSIKPGLGGVEMRGFPVKIITDENGYYSAKVPSGWSGTITPIKAGYSFNPPTKSFHQVNSNMEGHNYNAARITLTISGSVGLVGVAMRGLPGNPVTDLSGDYTVNIPFGWAGKVTPQREGFTFEPSSKTYSAVSEDMTNQDYSPDILRYTISGSVGIADVVMQGLPGEPVTDNSGRYSATVQYGWSGTVTPRKEGYTFEPAEKLYNRVHFNQDNQNYAAKLILLEISGDIGLTGVFMDGLPGAPVTDKIGRYHARVPFNWSGTVIPIKEGYEFTPPSRSYAAVTENMNDSNYFAELQMLTVTDVVQIGGTPIPGVKVTTSQNDAEGETTITDAKGRYTIKVPYGWSGEITLSKEGYEFDPQSKLFTNVTTNIRDGVPEPSTQRRPSDIYAANYRRRRVEATIPSTLGRAGGRRILIVPVDGAAPKDYLETREDLYIMSEILDERFKEPRMIQGVFRDFGDFFGRDNRQTDAVYMQGYGVVFMMEVDYTFTPAPQTQQQPEEQTKEVDSTWQRARENIFSPGGAGRINRPESARANDAQMVEEFKTELIRTLRHATNIRNIEPDEWVIFSVTGTGPQPDMMGGSGGFGQSFTRFQTSSSSRTSGYSSSVSGGYGGSAMGGGYGGGMGGYGGGMMGGMGGSAETGILPATVLTIRAKKSDVDKFAKDEIDYPQFQQKVQILMYRSSL